MRMPMLRFVALLAGAVVFTVSSPAAAQSTTRSAGSMPPAVRAATSFLYAAYPELVGRALEIQMVPQGDEWLVSLSEVVGAGREPADRPVLVRARFTYDTAGQLTRFSADGPLLSDGANAMLRDAIRKNPGWIESDADVELMRLGGASLVGPAFAPMVPATKTDLARHLGAGVTATAAEFKLRESQAGLETAAKAAWVVDATATDAAGKAVQYRLTYEPVGGKLVGVEQVGGAQ